MTNFSFLLPSQANNPKGIKEILLAREILENCILLAVKQHDIQAFERHIAQLKTYYFDAAGQKTNLPESQRQYTILGLNLLRLLALHKIADFHTELELIPLEMHDNIFIRHPIQLEQYIMEGSYNKVFEAAGDVPAESYIYFIEYLINQRLKDAIAESCESAYEHLSINNAKQLLHIDNNEALIKYAKERGWNVNGDSISFGTEEEEKKEIPSTKLVLQTLGYAKELERIV
eukprot:TRINITY_DN18153_c0_g1_i1.p1 TRINITY_DN18153_c0_g1~~TRINITY_DN18153_c0_g1_i1.p1  ORF type:complete len:239 (-),score=54.44 TRINITY_DN18153_c0_g1_i1:27-719(-)